MSWEDLYLEYNVQIYRYIFLMVGDKEIAEDLTHDTFIKVKLSLDSFRNKSSYLTWILSIGRNVVYDHWRKKKVLLLPIISSQTLITTETPAELYEKGEECRELYTAIKQLKLKYQEVIILRKIKELSIAETSIVLGWTESKVKSTLHQAMGALRVEVEKKRDGVENVEKRL